MNKYIILTILILLASSCTDEPDLIMTIDGPIPASELGITLPHEHILVDFIGADSSGYHRWVKQEVVDRALPFLHEIRELGCLTFIDCTPEFIGRDPELLRMLSKKTGLNIITNTGWYGANNNKYIPARAHSMEVEVIAEEWISEFHDGIENTGIKPGFIKIGVNRDEILSPMHEKLIRAAGLTHLATGLAIKSHTGPDGPALSQLAILEEMQIPAEAFIWTHAQQGTLETWIEVADRGAWISLDNIRADNFNAYVKHLSGMKSAGLLHRVLISHDSGWYNVGEENGGKYNGYTVIFRKFIPALKENGFTESEINMLMQENPATAFRIRKTEF